MFSKLDELDLDLCCQNWNDLPEKTITVFHCCLLPNFIDAFPFNVIQFKSEVLKVVKQKNAI